jgi:ADP-ribose pyrophosphatase
MKIISSTPLLQTPIFSVTQDHALDPDGFEIKRSIIQHPGSAVVMPVDDERRVLLVRQFRLPAQRFLWELPAGKIDPGETALQAARRELKEETGFRARKFEKLAEFYPSPGFLAEKMTIYLATGLTAGEQTPMEDERIEIGWYTGKEIERLIDSGKILDAKTNIGYFRWQYHLANGKKNVKGGKLKS